TIYTAHQPPTHHQEIISKDLNDGLRGENYTQIDNRKEAIHYAVKHAKKGDIILIAGKGHEDYQIIGKEKFHFDDREVAREALKERRK
ncbi:MAG: glutamate ligase domain-containing protein, partial [Mammaliicoccus vitulinus]